MHDNPSSMDPSVLWCHSRAAVLAPVAQHNETCNGEGPCIACLSLALSHTTDVHEAMDTGPQRKGRGQDGAFGYGSKETSPPTGHVIRSVIYNNRGYQA
jgi:hypothetical protein